MNDSTPIQPFPELTEKVEQLTAEVNRLKKAREALLAQNNLLDSLFEHVLMGMTVWDTQGRLLYANQGFTRLTGYSRTDIRTLDDWFPRAYPDAEYRAAVMAEWAASTALNNAVRTFAVTCKDGQVKTVEFRASFLANGRALVTLTDVTDMHRTKAALLKQTDRYQAFSNAAFEAMFVSVDGRCIDTNRAAEKMFGYRREELIGIFGTDVIAPESKAKVRENMASGYEDPYEAIAQRKDGTRFHVEIQGKMTEHHGRRVRIAVVHDIDQRKRAEKELKASESLLKSIFSSAPVGIGMVVDRVIRKANERLCEMTGYAQAELIGRGARMLYPTEADFEYVGLEKYRQIEAYGTGTVETRWRRKDGRIIDVLLSSTPLNVADWAQGVTFSANDITERKQLEKKLQQAQKMEAIGTLAGGIAHDFNNILMGIIGRTSLMMDQTDTHSPYFEHLSGIEEYVKSATDLTRQLLGFARGGKYQLKTIDLNRLVEKSARMFGRTKKELAIKITLDDRLDPVEVDPRQIEQVLLNLYVNAWQAMPDGGELLLKTENVILDEKDVLPYSVGHGHFVRVSVSDTGAGMDEATVHKIFDPFFTTKEMGRGTGLGLASAYGIVNNHGGFFTVNSKVGQGTTFNLHVPATTKPITREKDTPISMTTGKETILLVDDEKMVRDVGGQMLKKIGYTVHTARSGEEALQLFGQKKTVFDLVIIDMIMPGMNGGETYDRLKRIDPGIRVLLSSGYSIDGQAAGILARGCNGFIQKPFGMKELSAAIRKVLDSPGD
jgi:PAS domain S-box-containing protein